MSEMQASFDFRELICPQCGGLIDTSLPYEYGGRPGLLDQITRPSHLGACETMPVFAWAPAVRTVAAPVGVRKLRRAA